jgi:hypothetical protein
MLQDTEGGQIWLYLMLVFVVLGFACVWLYRYATQTDTPTVSTAVAASEQKTRWQRVLAYWRPTVATSGTEKLAIWWHIGIWPFMVLAVQPFHGWARVFVGFAVIFLGYDALWRFLKEAYNPIPVSPPSFALLRRFGKYVPGLIFLPRDAFASKIWFLNEEFKIEESQEFEVEAPVEIMCRAPEDREWTDPAYRHKEADLLSRPFVGGGGSVQTKLSFWVQADTSTYDRAVQFVNEGGKKEVLDTFSNVLESRAARLGRLYTAYQLVGLSTSVITGRILSGVTGLRPRQRVLLEEATGEPIQETATNSSPFKARDLRPDEQNGPFTDAEWEQFVDEVTRLKKSDSVNRGIRFTGAIASQPKPGPESKSIVAMQVTEFANLQRGMQRQRNKQRMAEEAKRVRPELSDADAAREATEAVFSDRVNVERIEISGLGLDPRDPIAKEAIAERLRRGNRQRSRRRNDDAPGNDGGRSEQ